MAKPKLMDRAWMAIQALPSDATFTVESLLDAHPDLSQSDKPGRAMGRAMSCLIARGWIRVAGQYRKRGDTCTRLVYALGAGPRAAHVYVNTMKDDEPIERVTRSKNKDGTTRVRFGQGWKPQHADVNTRALRGWQSPLASIYL